MEQAFSLVKATEGKNTVQRQEVDINEGCSNKNESNMLFKLRETKNLNFLCDILQPSVALTEVKPCISKNYDTKQHIFAPSGFSQHKSALISLQCL